MASITSMKLLPLDEPPNDDRFTLITQGEDTEIYRHVVPQFKREGFKVKKIEQLKNHHIWLKYKNEVQLIIERRPQDPKFELNETYLYHGTCASKNDLCEQGFDVNLASEGCFGKGIYFSDKPSKCEKYAKDTILIARVLLGAIKEYKDGEKNTALLQPPKKVPPFQGWRFYDSVKGRPRNFTEFVVYNNGSAFIEYIVTFSKTEDNVPTPSVAPECPQAEKAQAPDIQGSSDDEAKAPDSRSSSDDEADALDRLDSLSLGDPTHGLSTFSGNLAEKKKEFKHRTGEGDDSEVDSIFKKTDGDLERSVYLFYAYQQKKEEETKRQAGESVDDYLQEDDGSPIYPLMEPEYNSSTWNSLSTEEQKLKTDEKISDFLAATALEESHFELAKKYVSNASYNLDSAMLDFYRSWM